MTAARSRHIAYGRVIDADQPLPDLPYTPLFVDDRADRVDGADTVDDADGADVRVDISTRPVGDDGWMWIPASPDTDRPPRFRVGRRDTGEYRLRFDEAADFVVSANAARVSAHGVEGGDPGALRHVLIDQVIPLVLSHRGTPFLHASAVRVDGAIVAFLGPSGAGKSTLAAAFAHAGASLVADDALALEVRAGQWWGLPAYPGLRLWPDTLPVTERLRSIPVAIDTAKRRIDPADIPFARDPAPLRRLYVLSQEAADPVIRPVRLREAVMGIVGQTFALDSRDQVRLRAQFDWVCALATAVDVRSLSYPRQIERIGEVRAAIRRDLLS
jgi:hypothetical protein